MSPTEKLVYYLAAYADGVITHSELVTWLAQLPPSVVELIPPPHKANPEDTPSIRREAEKLRRDIEDDKITVMSSSGHEYTRANLQHDIPLPECDDCKRLGFLLREAVRLVKAAQKVYAATHDNTDLSDEDNITRRCSAEVALGWAFASVDQRDYAAMLEEADEES
jgi:hypothetical protein